MLHGTRLNASQLEGIRSAVLQGPTEHGFGTELWTLKRVGAVIERPTRVRTWAPKGCTPIIQFHFN